MNENQKSPEAQELERSVEKEKIVVEEESIEEKTVEEKNGGEKQTSTSEENRKIAGEIKKLETKKDPSGDCCCVY